MSLKIKLIHVKLNEDDEDEENYYKDIDEKEAIQHEEDEQPSEADIEVGCTSRKSVC